MYLALCFVIRKMFKLRFIFNIQFIWTFGNIGLILSILGEVFSKRHIEKAFYFFPEKIFDIAGKKKKKMRNNLSSADRIVKVNKYLSIPDACHSLRN